MSKRKCLSLEEKRTRMLDIFYEKKEFFHMKELEKIAPKEKGIISQSVKDVLQSLVDDGLVESDKIGTSIYYWAFPGKAQQQQQRRLDDLNKKLEELDVKLKKKEENVALLKIGREDSDERTEILKRLAEKQNEIQGLNKEIQKYKDNDPEVLEQMEKETKQAKEAANRWTDNIYVVKRWCKNKFNIEEAEMNKQFEIPEELDYIE